MLEDNKQRMIEKL